MTERERVYKRKQKELIAAAGHLSADARGRVRVLLSDLHKDVASRVAATEWQASHLPALRRAVAEAVASFETRYDAEAKEDLANSWRAGLDMVDHPLTVAGILPTAGPVLSSTALEIAQGFSADLIQGLAKDTLKKINGEIWRGVLGGKTLAQVMGAVGTSIDAGVFRSVALRAETITRTELARVQASARQARMQAVADGGTEPRVRMGKQWIHSGKPNGRANHMALDRVVVDMSEDFPGGIPYPHAPGLPAKETVNCGCVHVLEPMWDQVPGRFEPGRFQYQNQAIYD